MWVCAPFPPLSLATLLLKPAEGERLMTAYQSGSFFSDYVESIHHSFFLVFLLMQSPGRLCPYAEIDYVERRQHHHCRAQ